jgi:CheY-like chemotaxis protein
VIALADKVMTQEIQDGLQAGFFRYVTKPIRGHDFFNSLDAALLFAQHNANDSRDPPTESKDLP